jgi:cytoplasmic iron level regulating protein YaaA (DUF328/UPF0246 family)
VLILLPPSEGKSAPAEGPPLDLASLSFPALTRTRERVLEGLIRVSGQRNALAVLGVARGLAPQVERNTGLRGAPTQPAERVYTGVLYEALGLTALPRAARELAGSSVLIVSALFGVLRPADAIPAYRLSMDVKLSRSGALARVWKPVLDPVITAAAGDGPIVDCRSSTYAAAWRPSRALADRVISVRVLQERAGTRTIVSHMAKKTRGEVARQLLTSGREIRHPEDVAGALGGAFTIETMPPARPGAGWTIDVIVGA